MATTGSITWDKAPGGSPGSALIAGIDRIRVYFTNSTFQAGTNRSCALYLTASSTSNGGTVLASNVSGSLTITSRSTSLAITNQSYAWNQDQTSSPYTITVSAVYTSNIVSAGTNNIYFQFSESGMYPKPVWATVTVAAYESRPPVITDLRAVRCNGAGTEADDGSYIKVLANWTFNSMDGANAVDANFVWGRSDESPSADISIVRNVWSTPQGGAVFQQFSYVVSITLVDSYGETASKTITIPIVPVDWPSVDAYWGYMSTAKSNSDMVFESPITLISSFLEPVTINGLSFTFNIFDNSYCDDMIAIFVREDGTTRLEHVRPDNAVYYMDVEELGVAEIRMQFNGMNKPDRYLWIQRLVYGKSYIFTASDIVSHSILRETKIAGDDLPIGTMECTLLLKDDASIPFHRRKPIRSYFKNELVGTFYIDDADRISPYRWNLRCVDVVDRLERTKFDGGMYNNSPLNYDDTPLIDSSHALEMIRKLTRLTIELGDEYPKYDGTENSGVRISGWIPVCTCRYALAQIAFALSGIIDISNDGSITIRKIKDAVTSHISSSRILGEASVKRDKYAVRDVKVYSYAYTEKRNTDKNSPEYWHSIWENIAPIVQSGEPTRTYFSVPVSNINVNGIEPQDWQLISWSANYIEYAARKGASSVQAQFLGVPYVESEVMHVRSNPNLSDDEDAVSVEYKEYKLIHDDEYYNGSLVNDGGNAREVLDNAYDMAMRNETVSATVILGVEQVGDMVSIETKYGIKTGIITMLNVDINNSMIAQMEVRA